MVADFDVAVLGLGALGSRVTRQLASAGRRVAVYDQRAGLAERLASSAGPQVEASTIDDVFQAPVVVIATPSPQAFFMRTVATYSGLGISTSDDVDDVREMLDHDAPAIVGAAFAPGLSGLLARVLSDQLDRCDEIHISVHGTGGPACARQHHRVLGGTATGWHDGEWITRPAGSGRELCWFPSPVGPRDCYRAELADPLLIHRAFPDVDRISARVSATRRDRLTARLPMLSPPHSEGGVGGLRVEARGASDGERRTLVAGVAERAAVGAATMAAVLAGAALDGLLTITAPVTTADAGLPSELLIERVRSLGLTLHEYIGGETAVSW